MLKRLIKIANELDSRGLVKEADYLDLLTTAAAEGAKAPANSWDESVYLPKEVEFEGRKVTISTSGPPEHIYVLKMESDGREHNYENHHYDNVAEKAVEFLDLESDFVNVDSVKDINSAVMKGKSEEELKSMTYDEYFDAKLRARHIRYLLVKDLWSSTPAKDPYGKGYTDGFEPMKDQIVTDVYYLYKDVAGSNFASSRIPDDLSGIRLEELEEMLSDALRYNDSMSYDEDEDLSEYYDEYDNGSNFYWDMGYQDRKDNQPKKDFDGEKPRNSYRDGWDEADRALLNEAEEERAISYESFPTHEGKGRRHSDKHTERLAGKDAQKELAKLANELDSKGLRKEADYLDLLIKRAGVLDDRNYYMDRRTNAEDAWEGYDTRANTITISYTIYDEEDYETEKELELPAKFEICDLCEGRGSVVNPSIDAGGISEDEFDADPEFRESYSSGAYNISCTKCGGRGRNPVVNYEKLSEEQKKEFDQYQHDKAEEARDAENDRRTMMGEMGLGW